MSNEKSKRTTTSLIQEVVNMAWPYLRGKRGLVALGVGVVIFGLAMNWSWLVAAGIAPLLLSVCLA